MTALTAANQLTLLRMLLIPVLALLVLYDRMGWALIVLILAALTDASTACWRGGRGSTPRSARGSIRWPTSCSSPRCSWC